MFLRDTAEKLAQTHARSDSDLGCRKTTSRTGYLEATSAQGKAWASPHRTPFPLLVTLLSEPFLFTWQYLIDSLVPALCPNHTESRSLLPNASSSLIVGFSSRAYGQFSPPCTNKQPSASSHDDYLTLQRDTNADPSCASTHAYTRQARSSRSRTERQPVFDNAYIHVVARQSPRHRGVVGRR